MVLLIGEFSFWVQLENIKNLPGGFYFSPTLKRVSQFTKKKKCEGVIRNECALIIKLILGALLGIFLKVCMRSI